MYRWFLATSNPPHGTMAYGDGHYGDAADILVRGWKATGDRELLWPLRASGVPAKARPKRPGFTSTILRSSGYAVMRDGWDAESLYMSINFGQTGGWHTHCDLLNFDLFAHGSPLAVDTARYGPYDNPLDLCMRQAVAHNQVAVNDVDFDRQHVRGEQVVWSTQEHVDFFHARHRGYEKSHNVVIERTIIFVRGEYWFISDVIRELQRHHSYTWYLHSPWRWKAAREGTTRTLHAPGLLVVPAMPDEIRQVRRGRTYSSRDSAGHLEPPFSERHWVGYQKFIDAGDVVTYATALVPYASAPSTVRVAPVPVRRNDRLVQRGEAEAFEVVRGRRRDVFVFAHCGRHVRRYGRVETDARLAAVRLEGGRTTSVNAVGVSHLAVDGREILSARKRRREFSVKVRG